MARADGRYGRRFGAAAAGLSLSVLILGLHVATPEPVQGGVHLSAPRKVFSLWIGDSYTYGAGGGGPEGSASNLVSQAFGWEFQLDAQGGTGFVANGHANSTSYAPLQERLSQARSQYRADVIVVDAGRNDPDTAESRSAITDYLHALRADWPFATIVVILPWHTGRTVSSPFNAFLAEQARRIEARVDDPFARGWVGLTPQGEPKTRAYANGPQDEHPTAEGYRAIAEHLIADFDVLGLRDVRPTQDHLPGEPEGSVS